MSKPQLPQGTRDFSAAVVQRRQYIFQTIRSVFELYGFQPLETPAMENLDTLMGKYGEEGDKLIFKILNNGLENPTKLASATAGFEKVLAGKSSSDITERALRYDLTIPFARYVAMNQGQLVFPFKRYQIQPVWRADRPQKGRYREFTQCDCDIVGSKSLLNEVELLHIYATVFSRLGLAVEIQINHRSILSALAEVCGGPHLLTAITTAIDKIDKIGLEKVQSELVNAGLSENAIQIVTQYLHLEGTHQQKMEALAILTLEHPLMLAGAADLNYLHQMGPWPGGIQVVTKPTLARGLNYYTGTIFEVKALHAAMGSIGGGGRYDDLTGLFDVPGIPGVGISFGVDRIYDVLEQLQLFPESVASGTKVMFVNLGAAESGVAYAAMQAIRQKGVASEIYPDAVKLDKQFKYADKKNIPYAIIIGSDEMQAGVCKIKNLITGNQETISIASLPDYPFQ
ncbi:MAG: histidine--tRNA ligase [Chitinophagia bacterium]|nr:histidine--tRNA ligase [Chitinophagia bacterium]